MKEDRKIEGTHIVFEERDGKVEKLQLMGSAGGILCGIAILIESTADLMQSTKERLMDVLAMVMEDET